MKHRAQGRDENEAALPDLPRLTMSDSGAATTGVAPLDAALDGLYWGDNVVWEAEEQRTVLPFFDALAEHRDGYDLALYVSLTRSPEEVAVGDEREHPQLDL